MPIRFRDRQDAGRRLAARLRDADLRDPIVLALPREGVPVAFEVANMLQAPLEVFVARKVGAPGQPEFGIGAIAEGGGQAIDRLASRRRRLSPARFDALVADERRELDRRVRQFRGTRQVPALTNGDVVLVDDGLATGVTAEAALRALRARNPRRLLLAAPACAPEAAARLREIADDVVCVISPAEFSSVGQWYERFDQTTDEEVLDLLDRAAQRRVPMRELEREGIGAKLDDRDARSHDDGAVVIEQAPR